jgi:DNA-directed RNA polymerase specialized sigma24 family protein
LSLKAIGKQGKHIIIGINDTDIQQTNTVSMHKVESILQVCDEQESVINEKRQLVHDALGEMATRCRELLWSFYADELSWATIAAQFGLKNADTAKSQASRCRQTFKEKYNHLRMQSYGK